MPQLSDTPAATGTPEGPEIGRIRVRPAGADELDLVADLRLEFLADARDLDRAQLPVSFVELTRDFLDRAQAADAVRSWLAEADGRAVGIVTMLLYDMPPRPEELRVREGYIVNMYVEPAARRRGIGRSLLDACLASVTDLHIRRVFLHAMPDGRPMYEAAGFTSDDGWMELYPGR